MKGEMCSQAWNVQTKELLSLAWPAILEQLLLTTATYVDTAMIGVLGADATAAVAVNSSVVFLIVGLLTAAGVGYSVQVAHSLGAWEWERAAFSGGQLFMTRMVTSLGNISLAANHVAVTAEGISYLPAQGVSFASTALVGQAVGAKDAQRAGRYSSISGVVGLAAGILAGGLLFCLAVPLSALFTPESQVIALAAAMLRIVAVSEPLFGLSIVLSGVLRGAGDSRSPFLIVLFGMWGVRMIMAPVLLYGFHLQLSAIWIAMVADLMVRGVLCRIRVKRMNWEQLCQR